MAVIGCVYYCPKALGNTACSISQTSDRFNQQEIQCQYRVSSKFVFTFLPVSSSLTLIPDSLTTEMTTPSEDDITFMMKKCGIDPDNTEQRKSIWENMFGVISRTEQWPDEREFKEKPLMLKRLMQATDEREIQGRTKPLPKQLSVEAAIRKSMGERRKWSADGKVFMEATGCLKIFSKKELKVLKRSE